MTKRRRCIRAAGVLAGVAAMLLAAAPQAWARAVLTLPNCCATDEVAAGDKVFVLDQQPPGNGTEAGTLLRVDPRSNTITGQLRLPSGTPTGNTVDTEAMTVAVGSIWITSYFHNQVLRINPDTMQITARINVGRGPGSIITVGQSVWVVIQTDGFVDRIDPATNAVVQTVAVGRRGGTDFLYQAAWNGSQILVSLPGSGRVAHVDPVRGRVASYDAVGSDPASCARILPAPGGYWLDDTECSFTYYRWDSAAGAITTQIDPQPRGDWGAVVVGNAIYTGESRCNNVACLHGYLVKYDAVTGAKLAQRVVGIEDFLPHFAHGAFWVADWDDATLTRVAGF